MTDRREWERFARDQFDAGYAAAVAAAVQRVEALPEYALRDTCIAALRESHD